MKLTQNFYAFLFLLIHHAIQACDEQVITQQNTKLLELKGWIHALSEELQKNNPNDFCYIKVKHDEFQNLEQELVKTKNTFTNNISNENAQAYTKHKQFIEQLTAKHTNEKNERKKIYENELNNHNKAIANLSIDEQIQATQKMKTTTDTYDKDIENLEDAYAITSLKQQQDYRTEKAKLEEKESNFEAKYLQIQNDYYTAQTILDEKEENALIAAQKEYITHLKQREMDEIYTSAMQPSLWLLYLPSFIDYVSCAMHPQYSYQANENVMICNGCIEKDNFSINKNLKNKLNAEQNSQTLQALAMTAWMLHKSQAEDDTDHEVGILTCKKTGRNLSCRSIQDDLQKATTNLK